MEETKKKKPTATISELGSAVVKGKVDGRTLRTHRGEVPAIRDRVRNSFLTEEEKALKGAGFIQLMLQKASELGLGQKEIALEMGIDYAYFYLLRTGARDIPTPGNRGVFQKCATFLNKPLIYVLMVAEQLEAGSFNSSLNLEEQVASALNVMQQDGEFSKNIGVPLTELKQPLQMLLIKLYEKASSKTLLDCPLTLDELQSASERNDEGKKLLTDLENRGVEKGLGMGTLATRLGISYTAWTQYRNGRRSIARVSDNDFFIKSSRFMDKSIAYVMSEIGQITVDDFQANQEEESQIAAAIEFIKQDSVFGGMVPVTITEESKEAKLTLIRLYEKARETRLLFGPTTAADFTVKSET